MPEEKQQPKAVNLQTQVETGFVRTAAETGKDILGNVRTVSKISGHGLRAVRKKAANFEFFSSIEDEQARLDYIDDLPEDRQQAAKDSWTEIMNA